MTIRGEFVLVPRKATRDMVHAANKSVTVVTLDGTWSLSLSEAERAYDAMIAAAPEPQPEVAAEPVAGELLEWRDFDSHSEITYTEFGPYMVEELAEDSFRAWHPDFTENARVMIEGFTSRKSARASCQYDVDGRRAAMEGK